jgi:hypothetical protein
VETTEAKPERGWARLTPEQRIARTAAARESSIRRRRTAAAVLRALEDAGLVVTFDDRGWR